MITNLQQLAVSTQEADGLKYAYGAPKKKYLNEEGPNDTLKVDFTSIPNSSRNLRWPQNIGGNGCDNAICDWEFWKKSAYFDDFKNGWKRQKIKKN